MVIQLRPERGGYIRPFGCGWFIREFLLGHGPEGAAVIDPESALVRRHFLPLQKNHPPGLCEDAVAWENEERIKKGKSIYNEEEYADRFEYFLSRYPTSWSSAAITASRDISTG
jgi:hypothetical protein